MVVASFFTLSVVCSGADWLGWEQSYNCKSGDIMEIMARTAMFNRAIMFYTASGAFVPEECEYANVSQLDDRLKGVIA